jgi:hypothetical protein
MLQAPREEDRWSPGNQFVGCPDLSIWYYWFDGTRWGSASSSLAIGAYQTVSGRRRVRIAFNFVVK